MPEATRATRADDKAHGRRRAATFARVTATRRWAGRRSEGLLYLAAALTYVAAGVYWKGLLNWIVGPAWLVAWVWLVPAGWRRLRGVGPDDGPEPAGPGSLGP